MFCVMVALIEVLICWNLWSVACSVKILVHRIYHHITSQPSLQMIKSLHTTTIFMHARTLQTEDSTVLSVSYHIEIFMPLPPTTGDERHYVFQLSIHCSAVHQLLSINTSVTWCDISVLSGGISMKLSTNIHHVSGFSRSCVQTCECCNGGRIHFDSVASSLTCLTLVPSSHQCAMHFQIFLLYFCGYYSVCFRGICECDKILKSWQAVSSGGIRWEILDSTWHDRTR